MRAASQQAGSRWHAQSTGALPSLWDRGGGTAMAESKVATTAQRNRRRAPRGLGASGAVPAGRQHGVLPRNGVGGELVMFLGPSGERMGPQGGRPMKQSLARGEDLVSRSSKAGFVPRRMPRTAAMRNRGPG